MDQWLRPTVYVSVVFLAFNSKLHVLGKVAVTLSGFSISVFKVHCVMINYFTSLAPVKFGTNIQITFFKLITQSRLESLALSVNCYQVNLTSQHWFRLYGLVKSSNSSCTIYNTKCIPSWTPMCVMFGKIVPMSWTYICFKPAQI